MTQIAIRPATTAEDIAAVRRLCCDYRSHLSGVSAIDAQLTETFYPVPKYTALMDALEQIHARPTGIILLAKLDQSPVACAMIHALDPDTAEIKRVYVAPAARRQGIARKLMLALMDSARSDGYARVVLDTSLTLGPARALYTSLGFAERDPYQDLPAEALPHLIFFEARL